MGQLASGCNVTVSASSLVVARPRRSRTRQLQRKKAVRPERVVLVQSPVVQASAPSVPILQRDKFGLPLFHFLSLFVPRLFRLAPSELQPTCRVRLYYHPTMACLRTWRCTRLTVLCLLLGSSFVSAQSASTTSAVSSAANSSTASSTSSLPITHTVNVAQVRIGDLQRGNAPCMDAPLTGAYVGWLHIRSRCHISRSRGLHPYVFLNEEQSGASC